jgi:hypothetical protein
MEGGVASGFNHVSPTEYKVSLQTPQPRRRLSVLIHVGCTHSRDCCT